MCRAIQIVVIATKINIVNATVQNHVFTYSTNNFRLAHLSCVCVIVESNGSSSSQSFDHPDTAIVPESKQETAGEENEEQRGICSQEVLTLPCSISLPAGLHTSCTGHTGVVASDEVAVSSSEDIAEGGQEFFLQSFEYLWDL